MTQIPLLIMSDGVNLPTGLARIARDLAWHVTQYLPQFRVGTLGRSGSTKRSLPWPQYHHNATDNDQWGITSLPATWDDFAHDEAGILLTIQDPSRMYLLSNPQGIGEPLETFLKNLPIQKWGYFPVDSTGPGDKLSGICSASVRGYDRVLAYTKFGADVLSRSIGRSVDWIPHGIDMEVFQPRGRGARVDMEFDEDHIVIGCNMTNQPRKDWGLWASIAAHLCSKSDKYRFWAHTDVIMRSWSLPALMEDFGLEGKVSITMAGSVTDEQLSYLYSACDLTILPSLGEGFGYPIVESMACGVPCYHINYAGGAEFASWKDDPVSWRIETPYNCIRPVLSTESWVSAIESLAVSGPCGECRNHVEYLDWRKLWPSCWQKWFEEGIA